MNNDPSDQPLTCPGCCKSYVILCTESLVGVEGLPPEHAGAQARVIWKCQGCGLCWDLTGRPTGRVVRGAEE